MERGVDMKKFILVARDFSCDEISITEISASDDERAWEIAEFDLMNSVLQYPRFLLIPYL